MPDPKLEVIADPDKPTIVTRRVVDAPRALVFDAFTKPEHIVRWMGPKALTWVVCESDLRVGGKYRWVQRAPDGNEYGFHGEFKEIVRPEKIVRTFVFDGMPDAEALETLTLEERGGKTSITTLTVHKTIQARDGHLAGGMEGGMSEGYARLDELLVSLQSPMFRKVAFTMVPVKDWKRARAFYGETLGLPKGIKSPDGVWTEYDLPGGGCVALFGGPTATPSASGTCVAFEVADLDSLIARLEGQGVKFLSDMIHSPVCRMRVILDSEGNSLLLHELKKK